MTYTEKKLEEFDQGCFYSKFAPDDWNDENAKGYLAAVEDIRPFLIESIQGAVAEEGTGNFELRVCDVCGSDVGVGIYEGQAVCQNCWAKTLTKEEIETL